jgi:hypothetical protein
MDGWRDAGDELAHHGAARSEQMRGHLSPALELADGLKPFLCVSAQQVRRRLSAQDQRELPAQVDHVLDAGVRSLPRGGRIGMSRAPAEEDTAVAQRRGQAPGCHEP